MDRPPQQRPAPQRPASEQPASGRPAPATAFFLPHATEVAPLLLGAVLTVDSEQGEVGVRISEVEAYLGLDTGERHDPGSHARSGRTERNASMFGPPAHAYVYFSYGMHYALNMVCSPEGSASGVLIRAGEVVAGRDLARSRRGASHREVDLARGPGRLAQALGITRERHDGLSLLHAPLRVELAAAPPQAIRSGPRVGVSGVAGTAEFPWRFWIDGDPTVSAYRRAVSRTRPRS